MFGLLILKSSDKKYTQEKPNNINNCIFYLSFTHYSIFFIDTVDSLLFPNPLASPAKAIHRHISPMGFEPTALIILWQLSIPLDHFAFPVNRVGLISAKGSRTGSCPEPTALIILWQLSIPLDHWAFPVNRVGLIPAKRSKTGSCPIQKGRGWGKIPLGQPDHPWLA